MAAEPDIRDIEKNLLKIRKKQADSKAIEELVEYLRLVVQKDLMNAGKKPKKTRYQDTRGFIGKNF